MKAMVLTGHGGPEMLRYGEWTGPKRRPPMRSSSIFMRPASMPRTTRCGWAGLAIISGFRTSWAATSPVWLRQGAKASPISRSATPVFGVLDAGIEGAYAEKLAIKAAIVARKPDRLSHLQAAAMALTGITAIWAIEDTAQLQAGETILIQGGAGGVAGFAIQLAKASRRHRGHDDQRRERRLCSRPRSRPRGRLQRRGLHQGRLRTATWCSTRSGATFRRARTAC